MCVFKMLFGLLAVRAGTACVWLYGFGCLIMGWALADFIMNIIRMAFYLSGRPSPVEYCTIAQAGRIFNRPRLFLAVDTLFSFSFICIVLWSGWITMLGRQESYFWYAATTLNLISVSVVNIWLELREEP